MNLRSDDFKFNIIGHGERLSLHFSGLLGRANGPSPKEILFYGPLHPGSHLVRFADSMKEDRQLMFPPFARRSFARPPSLLFFRPSLGGGAIGIGQKSVDSHFCPDATDVVLLQMVGEARFRLHVRHFRPTHEARETKRRGEFLRRGLQGKVTPDPSVYIHLLVEVVVAVVQIVRTRVGRRRRAVRRVTDPRCLFEEVICF